MMSPEGRVQADATTYLEYPNHVRVETKLQEVASVQVYDGEHAWVRDPSGVHEVPERFRRDLEMSLKRDTISLLLAADRGTVRSRLLPDLKDDAGRRYHALELSATDLEPVVLYLDPNTNLISKQTYVVGGTGQPLIEEVFNDYRPVDGIQIAHLAAVSRGGQPILERRVAGVKINTPSIPRSFDAPLLDRSAHVVVRRSVRRPVRRRAHARAACARS